ncbi:dTDP-4-dehydrorhamnose reductase [Planctomycetes bacterium K23_9]|uniref:dTDP-4-dehydrorhamnose reductase n=1 Tax=Stieleria marina TaxID=1930275 RepID=A0A517NNU1_9BACT|nr:dTDP-4-dehydrorhamnose reductase [Planctomycetes bacterium K23_9]
MIVVTGANGQLGRNFCRQLNATGLDRDKLDISDQASVAKVLGGLRPSVVVNCAAYTAVDAAEDDPATCYAINSTGAQNLAQVAAQHNALLVHISTDYVFGSNDSGSKDVADHPHQEHDAVSPESEYAKSKLQGERFAAQCPNHLILRTCGLYGVGGNNFVETMLRLAGQRSELSIVDDQICNPTSTATIVKATERLIAANQNGLFHVVNSGEMSWYDFAAEIFRQSNLDIKLTPISSEQFGAKAPRPRYSALDTKHYENATGDSIASIPTALAEYLETRKP